MGGIPASHPASYNRIPKKRFERHRLHEHAVRSWPHSLGCGSKHRYHNGTLVSGNMDHNLRFASCLILSHSHFWNGRHDLVGTRYSLGSTVPVIVLYDFHWGPFAGPFPWRAATTDHKVQGPWGTPSLKDWCQNCQGAVRGSTTTWELGQVPSSTSLPMSGVLLASVSSAPKAIPHLQDWYFHWTSSSVQS